MDKHKRKKPYSERPLVERVETNWRKTIGLYHRSEYSTVAIRAATTVELAANVLIEHEFIKNRQLPRKFVEGLMKWANGFMGKLDKLVIPIYKGTDHEQVLTEVRKRTKDINDERNKVVHLGQFKRRTTAARLIKETEFVVNSLVRIVDSSFSLKTPDLDSEDEDA